MTSMVAPVAFIPTSAFAVIATPVACVSELLQDGTYFIEDSMLSDDGSAVVVGTYGADGLADDTQGFVAKFSPDGDLDYSFGDRGVVRIDLGGRNHIAYGVVVDSVGRLAIGGTVWSPQPSGFAMRLLADGSTDTAFGSDGVTRVPEAISDVALGDGGRLLFSAQDVIALDTNGDVDLGFGSGGRAGLTGVFHTVVQPSGRIVALSGGATVHAVGLTADGGPDPTFGSGGTTDVTLTSFHFVTDAAVAPDGTMAVAGQNWSGGATNHGFVIRLLPSGVPDPAFVDAMAWDTSNTSTTSVTIAPDLSMAAAMSGFLGTYARIVKLTPDGELDEGFGDGGMIESDGLPWSLRLRTDGGLVASVSQLGDAAALFGFDESGDCFDPLGAIDEPVASYHALPPARIADTRVGLGRDGTVPLSAAGSFDLQVAGRGGVPEFGVSAVVLNITVTDAAGIGYVTAWPSGEMRPTASNLNVEAVGQTVASLVTVPVSAAGAVSLYVQGGGHVVADVMGYYSPGDQARSGRLETIEPDRVLDTRVASGAAGVNGRPAAGETVRLRVTAPEGPVPVTASAVVLNVTATESASAGFITVSPGGHRSGTSNLNVTRADQTVANQVIVPIAPDGTIEFFTQTGTHLIADVAGWFTGDADERSADGLFVSTIPTRHLDTRTTTPVGASSNVRVDVAGAHSVPSSGASAIVGTMTVTNTTGPGFFTAYPGSTGVPIASSLNVERAAQTIANHITMQLDNGDFQVFAQSGGDVIIDITGWFTST